MGVGTPNLLTDETRWLARIDKRLRALTHVSQVIHDDQTVILGSTSGSIVASMPFQTDTYKKVIIYTSALNGTATYTFPVPFTNVPAIYGSSGTAAPVLNTTTVTLSGVGSGQDGIYILEGF